MAPSDDLHPGPDGVAATAMKRLLLFLLIVAVYVVHQDNWNWNTAEPLVFGFLPIGLAYHAAYSILCAGLMAVLVKTAWPAHLEQAPPPNGDQGDASKASR